MYKIRKLKVELKKGNIFLNVYKRGSGQEARINLKIEIEKRISELKELSKIVLIYEEKEKEVDFVISAINELKYKLNENRDDISEGIKKELLDKGKNILIEILKRNKKDKLKYEIVSSEIENLSEDIKKKLEYEGIVPDFIGTVKIFKK